jgi:DNA-binding transcriptional ArsR family regulator
MPAQLEADPVDTRVVKALGHPTRVRILNVLRDRELASPVELSAELGVALGTVGYHVRRLEALGFIELARRTQRRGAVEHHYRARQLLDVDVENGAAEREDAERTADASTGRGGEAISAARAAHTALAAGGFDALAAHADRRVLVLDPRGRDQLRRALVHWQTALEQIADASAARLAEHGEPPAHTCVAVLMAFDVPAGLGED